MSGITLRFDRLSDGTLVAVHQGVAAIVHQRRILDPNDPLPQIRWALAGDLHSEDRPAGACPTTTGACVEAAEALGVHLGVPVAAYEVAL